MTQTLAQKPSFRRVLSNKPLTLLWLGQLVSQSGDYIFDVAALWLVYQTTGDPLKVGLAVAATLLPAVLVGPFAGVYIDKFNRRSIMIVANIFQAVIAAAIAVIFSLGSLNFPVLLGLLFTLNSGALFVRPAVTAVIPAMTEKEDLPAANSLFSLSASVNQIAGYGLGGALVLVLGPTLPIYYDVLTFVFAAGMVSRITTVNTSPPSTSPLAAPAPVSFKDKFLQGLNYIRNSKFFIELVAVGLILNFFGVGIFALLLPYSKTVIKGDAGTYGIILALFSLGTILGSIVAGKIDSRRYVGKILFLGVIAIGVTTAGMGLTNIAILALGLSLVTGLFQAVVNVPMQVLVQTKVPGELLGRVITSLVALLTIAQPISAATAGVVARSLTIGETFQLYGVVMVLVSAGSYFLFSELRNASY